VESVRADLAAIVKAGAGDREALVEAFAAGRAAEAMEAVKRFRNPELRPLFHRLLAHDDWRVVHRALFALEHYGDATALPKAWALLSHAEARLREKAAIACLVLWDPKALPEKNPGAALAALKAKEGNLHVRGCLEALEARARGKLPVEKVHDEPTVTLDDGLLVAPFLEGMENARKVAPGVTLKGTSKQGGGSAMKLPVAPRWTTPVLGQGSEEVSGVSLQPFANLRANGTVYHTGQDVGACLDGAGFYAAADGIVKFVHTGSDMGTLVCVEHRVAAKELATFVYMHGGSHVFVKAGDRVAPGQLLTLMGMGYSFENGGHFAHLHLGIYPGPFQVTHNFGYRAVAAGLADWHDPAVVLPLWIERTQAAAGDLEPLVPALAAAVEPLRARAYAKALAALGGATGLDDAAKADAERVRKAIEGAGPACVERAKAHRAKGYPGAARGILAAGAAELAGVPGGDAPAAEGAAWDKDPSFAKDLKAEAAFDDAVEKEAALGAKGATKAKALWADLLEHYGDTCLGDRIRARASPPPR
jgi:murein DD-endopeptidase MepM/ murein hydrolase activator NlpD